MKKFILILLTILIAYVNFSSAFGQSVTRKTIQWNATSILDIETGHWTDEPSYFVSSPGKLEWKNMDGSVRHTFQILNSSGAWENPGQNGSVRFEVSVNNVKGSITIQRMNKDFAVIILVNTQPTPIAYELTIEGFSEIKGNG